MEKMMGRRLLMICDLGTIHWNVGEYLHFQEVALVERIKCEAEIIDIAWLYNRNEPAFGKTGVTRDNCHYYLSKLLPLAHVNSYLGSFTLADSLNMLRVEKYDHIFPSLAAVERKERVFRMPIVDEFYEKNGYIPHISCNEGMLLWARSFFELRGVVFPVAVHLRKSERNVGHRNSNLDAWMSFFSFCRSKKKWRKVKFVVIGTRQEIDPRFREIGNVVFSKDYNTTAEQDCALIQSSLMYMAGPSGPAWMAMYSDIPYLIFNFKMSPPTPNVFQWPWHTSLQKLIWVPETVDSLVKEFAQLIGRIDLSEWNRRHAELSFPKLKRRHKQKPDDW